MTEKEIQEKYRPFISECSCDKCKGMCKRRPCWGTPDEMEKVINTEFVDRLMIDYWADLEGDIKIVCPAIKGYEKRCAPFWPTGQCSLFTPGGLCPLHNLGLKPIEGRVASCITSEDDSLHGEIAEMWDTEKGRSVVQLFKQKIGE